MYPFELPSGPEIELTEMTGIDEDLLTNQRLVKNGEAINRVLVNCIKRIGDNDNPSMKEILDMLAGDRLFALVRLRQVSLGDEVNLELTCSNTACGEVTYVTVNLNDLEVTPYGDKREFDFTLPGSEKVVRFNYLDGHGEKRLVSIRNPNITTAMMIRIVSIDGNAPSKKFLAEMSLRDRKALRDEMRRVDGGIDTMVVTNCESCGVKLQTKLELEPAFLFPLAV